MLLSLATAFVFGLLPAIRASRTNLQASLHGDGRKTSRAPTSLARRLLVAADLALAVVLLIGAGLMIKSVGHLLAVNPGFDPDRVLTMQISMVGEAVQKGRSRPRQDRRNDRAAPRAAGRRVGRDRRPDSARRQRRPWGFHVQGRVAGPQDPSVERYSVTPDYFSVMRIPLRRGRLFTDADRASAEQVMLVGEQTARTALAERRSDRAARAHRRCRQGPWRTIVGIVGDVRHQELAAPPTMQMYTPTAQVTDSFLTVVIRSGGDPAALAAVARQTIWSIASDVPVYQVAPLSGSRGEVGRRRGGS